MNFRRHKTVFGVTLILLVCIVIALVAARLSQPGLEEYAAAGKQADVIAKNYNQLQAAFTTEFLTTDAADVTRLAPVQNQVKNLRREADKLSQLPALKSDKKLAQDYKLFRPKLDNTLNATQDLIDGKKLMAAKIYPVCNISNEFKVHSDTDGISAEIAPCRAALDGINTNSVKSTDVRNNIAYFRAGLKTIDQLATAHNKLGIGLAILATIDSKSGATDFGAYVDGQHVSMAFKTLTTDISAKQNQK